MMDLTKPDKKVARMLIEKGLNKELTAGLTEFSNILKEWEQHLADNHAIYRKLYKSIRNFDKHIAWRYDNLTGSHYLSTVISLFDEGLIDEKDLENLSEPVRKQIYEIIELRNR